MSTATTLADVFGQSTLTVAESPATSAAGLVYSSTTSAG